MSNLARAVLAPAAIKACRSSRSLTWQANKAVAGCHIRPLACQINNFLGFEDKASLCLTHWLLIPGHRARSLIQIPSLKHQNTGEAFFVAHIESTFSLSISNRDIRKGCVLEATWYPPRMRPVLVTNSWPTWSEKCSCEWWENTMVVWHTLWQFLLSTDFLWIKSTWVH